MQAPKVWLITGISTGFGRSMTELVLKRGEIAVATLRTPSAISDLASQYPPDRLLVLKLDVTQPTEITAVFAKIKETFCRLDVVYNNAGFGRGGGNTRGIFAAAVEFMRDVNEPEVGGRILQASSLFGILDCGGLGYYSAIKYGLSPHLLSYQTQPTEHTYSALEGLTDALVKELDPAWNIKLSLSITILEAGYYRTTAVTQNHLVIPPHKAYTNPSTENAQLRKAFAALDQLAIAIEGDPEKFTQTVYKLAYLPNPPLRLPLGKDAYERLRRMIAALTLEGDMYESWSDDLEFD